MTLTIEERRIYKKEWMRRKRHGLPSPGGNRKWKALNKEEEKWKKQK